jgi:hypothetical protein
VDIAYFESGLHKRIAAGHCRPNECDAVKLPGGRIWHRARGAYQIQYNGAVSSTEWLEMDGVSEYNFFVASYTAARLLGSHEQLCKGISGAISGFATGGRCGWSGARSRFATYKRLLLRVSAPVVEKPAVAVVPCRSIRSPARLLTNY